MNSFHNMLRLQAMLLIFLLVGVYVRKRNIVTKEAQPYFSEFLIQVALPCMIFSSFGTDSGPEVLLSAAKMLLISSAISLLSHLAGLVLYRKISPERRAVMQYGTLVSNAGFAGFPQVQGMFGDAGLFYASIYLVPLRFIKFSLGISYFMKGGKLKERLTEIMLNPCMLAVYLGMPRSLLQISLPSAVDAAINTIGSFTNPLSMIIIGMVVADVPLRSAINRDSLYLAFVRLLLLPAVIFAAFSLFNADPILKGVAIMLTAMPVGTNTPILAQKYGSDHEFASKCVLVSTILSIGTLPIISTLL